MTTLKIKLHTTVTTYTVLILLYGYKQVYLVYRLKGQHTFLMNEENVKSQLSPFLETYAEHYNLHEEKI